MTIQLSTIVKYTGYLNHAVVAGSIQKEMTGCLDAPTYKAASTVLQVIGPCAFDHQFRPFFGARTFRVNGDITKSLLDKGFVACFGCLTELLLAPLKNLPKVFSCFRSKYDALSKLPLRHASDLRLTEQGLFL